MLMLAEQHLDFRHLVRDFAQTEIAPHAAVWDQQAAFPSDIIHLMGDLGLFGLTVAEEYGGAGLSKAEGPLTSLCIAIEEIGRVDQSMGITLEAAVSLGINPLATFGTAAQKQYWLPDLVSGRALAAFGLTEPEAGSDAAATQTTAVWEQSRWWVSGNKQFITNAGTELTSCVTVTARTGEVEGKPEISTFIVPSDIDGLIVHPTYHKLGWHASDTRGITLENVGLPAEAMLGERGRGYAQFLATLDAGRIAIGALALGCVEACLELALGYAKERHTFGRPIGANQGVAFQLADLKVMAEASRALVYQAAALSDFAAPIDQVKQAASIAKLYATESAVTAARVASQVFGGSGFMEDNPIARFYRDAKILEIGEGTSEIQRLLIARSLGLPVR
jgi:short-chain 2-methylacyl-CoA dehydrogenase